MQQHFFSFESSELQKKGIRGLVSLSGHDPLPHQVRRLKDFIESNAIEVLNVAGPRESNEPGVYRFTLYRQYGQQSIVAFSFAFPLAVIFSVPEIIISLACAETAFRHNS
jgi:hypothetical protein